MLTSNRILRSMLLIVLLSAASIRRKLLKTTHTQEHSVQTNTRSCIFSLRSLIIPLNLKLLFHAFQHTIDKCNLMHSYKVDIHNIYRKLILRSQLLFTAGAGFSNNSGKYELSSSLSEILETGMIIFKSNLGS